MTTSRQLLSATALAGGVLLAPAMALAQTGSGAAQTSQPQYNCAETGG